MGVGYLTLMAAGFAESWTFLPLCSRTSVPRMQLMLAHVQPELTKHQALRMRVNFDKAAGRNGLHSALAAIAKAGVVGGGRLQLLGVVELTHRLHEVLQTNHDFGTSLVSVFALG